MGATDDLLKNNAAFAEGFGGAGMPAPPAKKVAVLTCMDARLDPARALGLDPGDAHVIRNAGGVVTDDAIRSLAISQHLLGTEEIIVIHHTRCGLLDMEDDAFEQQVADHAGERPTWRAHAFASDLETEVRASIERLQRSVFLPRRDNVRGFVYDVDTGRLSEVTPA